MFLSILLLSLCIACGSTTSDTAEETLPNISGTVIGDTVEGVTVALTGTATSTTTTAADGTYSFASLSAGDYTLTPSKTGAAFNPVSEAVTLTDTTATVNFESSITEAEVTYSISGTVTGDVINGVTVTLSGDATSETTTASDGTYSFTGLSAGAYTVTPTINDITAFSPTSSSVTLSTTDGTASFESASYATAEITSPLTSGATTISGSLKRCSDSGDLQVSGLLFLAGTDNAGCDDDGQLINQSYFSFDLSGADINANATIVSASLSFTQTATNTPYSGANSLIIDHFDFGASLDIADWATGKIGTTTAAINTSIANSVSITGLEDEVQADLDATPTRTRTQFRLKFTTDPTANNYITVTNPTLTVQYYQFTE